MNGFYEAAWFDVVVLFIYLMSWAFLEVDEERRESAGNST